MKEIRINIYQELGTGAAISSDDGKVLYEKIVKALKTESLVILDFLNIEFLTSAFLNTAIGQLYSKFEGSYLRIYLKVENMEKEDLALLKQVILKAKEYFKK